MKRSRPAVLCLAIALPFGLTACGGSDAEADGSTGADPTVPDTAAASDDADAVPAPTLADGPGVCFAAVSDHLGADTEVSEVDTDFSAGAEIDPDVVNPEDTAPAGELTYCSAKYRDPEDPNQLLEVTLDLATGEFGEPTPLEITVTGDASEFDLADYVIPLSEIDLEPLAGLMEQRTAELDGIYGQYEWTDVDLSAPDAFSADHRLRLGVTGRLAANDILEHGFVEVSVDGGSVVSESLGS